MSIAFDFRATASNTFSITADHFNRYFTFLFADG
nr:MAG TPA: hypothetical protein [Caudoviricetes sp.]